MLKIQEQLDSFIPIQIPSPCQLMVIAKAKIVRLFHFSTYKWLWTQAKRVFENLAYRAPKSAELLVANVSIRVYIDDLIDFLHFVFCIRVSLVIVGIIDPKSAESEII